MLFGMNKIASKVRAGSPGRLGGKVLLEQGETRTQGQQTCRDGEPREQGAAGVGQCSCDQRADGLARGEDSGVCSDGWTPGGRGKGLLGEGSDRRRADEERSAEEQRGSQQDRRRVPGQRQGCTDGSNRQTCG